MGLRFNAPSSSGATGAAHNSDCHVGRRLLLPVTKKCSTLQSAMSRLRKGEMHVQFLSQEFIRLFTAGYHVLLWLEGFLKPFVCGMGSLFFLRLKLQARRTQLTQRCCFCVSGSNVLLVCSWFIPEKHTKSRVTTTIQSL